MMISENPTVCCIKCKDYIGSCFCSCPYCGKMTENCRCNLESSRDGDKVLSKTDYPEPGFLKQSKKPSAVCTKDDDGWWAFRKVANRTKQIFLILRLSCNLSLYLQCDDKIYVSGKEVVLDIDIFSCKI